jgi:phenylalanyl-tRNA synthetase alpha chain
MPTPEEVIQSIESILQVVENDYRCRFASASTPEALNIARACVLGREGPLTEVLRMMSEVHAERKREMGGRINAFRANVESAYHARMVEIR